MPSLAKHTYRFRSLYLSILHKVHPKFDLCFFLNPKKTHKVHIHVGAGGWHTGRPWSSCCGGIVTVLKGEMASRILYQQASSCHLTSHWFLARLSDCWGTGKSPSYNNLALSTPLYVYFHGEPWNLFLAAQVFVWKEVFLSNPAGRRHNYLNREWYKPQKTMDIKSDVSNLYIFFMWKG